MLVVGGGYVGLITAVGLVKLGHDVELIEKREDRVRMHVTTAASAANAGTQRHFAERVIAFAGGVSGRTVAFLGLAFKAGTDDVRDSPSLNVAALLRDAGAVVRGYDPQASDNAKRVAPWLKIARDVESAVTDADVVVLGTEWPRVQGRGLGSPPDPDARSTRRRRPASARSRPHARSRPYVRRGRLGEPHPLSGRLVGAGVHHDPRPCAE